jgi:hypothetical protein
MTTTALTLFLVVAFSPAGMPTAVSGARAAAQEQAATLTGTWALTVETGQGTGNPTVTLKQDGEKLTGTYVSQVFGEQPVTGTVKGAAFTFSFKGSFEGSEFVVTYDGTVEKDRMKGKVTLGDMGEGTFTGTRK